MKAKDYVPVILTIVLICAASYFLLPAYMKLRQTRETVRRLQESLNKQELEVQRLRKELADLQTDYRAIERVAREKFGLCREDEKIYHFDDKGGLKGPNRAGEPQ